MNPSMGQTLVHIRASYSQSKQHAEPNHAHTKE